MRFSGLSNLVAELLLVVVGIALAVILLTVLTGLGGTSCAVERPMVTRVVEFYVYKVGDTWEGILVLYVKWSHSTVDLVYFYSRDGALEAIGKTLPGFDRLHDGLNVIKFAVVEGRLEPGHEYTIKLGVEGTGMVGVAGTHTPSLLPAKRYTVYVVRVPGAYGQYVSDPQELAEYLSVIGEVKNVTDPEELERVLEKADRYTIIINTHGEAVPSPSWVWEGAGYWDVSAGVWVGEPPNWQDWYSKIRSAILRGAIWVNVGGWPFYYITNNTYEYNETEGRVYGFYQVGIEWADYNWNSWSGWYGYDYIVYNIAGNHSKLIDCYLPVDGALFTSTDRMRKLADLVKKLYGLTAPLEHVYDIYYDRACKFNQPLNSPLEPYQYYSSNGDTWYSVYWLRLGSGYIVHIGYGTTITEDERTALILAVLLDLTAQHEG